MVSQFLSFGVLTVVNISLLSVHGFVIKVSWLETNFTPKRLTLEYMEGYINYLNSTVKSIY